MFEWLSRLVRHKCKFMIIDEVCVVNKHGRCTRYMRMTCSHILCCNMKYFPHDNRKIHEEWIEKGDI